jgi:phosphoglycerate dehydrogenase-like enzyme
LREASRLRWLQAPQAAPPAGWYYPELIAHPAVVTNFREIYNDHIGAHIMAFILAFARGLHHYLPQQLKRQWRRRRPSRSSTCLRPRSSSAWAALTRRPRGPQPPGMR